MFNRIISGAHHGTSGYHNAGRWSRIKRFVAEQWFFVAGQLRVGPIGAVPDRN
jgi:hypothetical protein